MKVKFFITFLIFTMLLLFNGISVFANTNVLVEGFGNTYLKELEYNKLVKGSVKSYEDLEGKPAILVFGKSTCGNCKSYLAHMNSLIDEFNIQNEVNLLFVGIDDTYKTMSELADDFYSWTNINYYYGGKSSTMFNALDDCSYYGSKVSYAVVFYIDKNGDCVTYSTESITDLKNIDNLHKVFNIDESILGDINNDGKISIADTSLAYSFYRGKSNPVGNKGLLADYDKNGKISIADVSLIYSKYRNK